MRPTHSRCRLALVVFAILFSSEALGQRVAKFPNAIRVEPPNEAADETWRAILASQGDSPTNADQAEQQLRKVLGNPRSTAHQKEIAKAYLAMAECDCLHYTHATSPALIPCRLAYESEVLPNNEHYTALAYLGSSLAGESRFAESADALEKFFAETKTTDRGGKEALTLGIDYLAAKDFPAAIRWLNRSLRASDSDPHTKMLVGQLLPMAIDQQRRIESRRDKVDAEKK